VPSRLPPALKGTMIFSGFVGHSCAVIGADALAKTKRLSQEKRTFDRLRSDIAIL
jgi:hypothetical protein